MITKQDLQEAIAECKGKRNPNAETCIKLAAYYTLLDHMDDRVVEPKVSYSAEYSSDSEFSHATKGKSLNEILEIMDELMEALYVMNPKLYDAVMRKVSNL